MSISKTIEVGKYNKLPHYCVVGHPHDFYVYVNEDGCGKFSNWLKGRDAFRLWHEMNNMKDKGKLVETIKRLFEENKKS